MAFTSVITGNHVPGRAGPVPDDAAAGLVIARQKLQPGETLEIREDGVRKALYACDSVGNIRPGTAQ